MKNCGCLLPNIHTHTQKRNIRAHTQREKHLSHKERDTKRHTNTYNPNILCFILKNLEARVS